MVCVDASGGEDGELDGRFSLSYDAPIDECIKFAESRQQAQDSDSDSEGAVSPPGIPDSSTGFGGDDQSNTASLAPDPHAVSEAEADSYYAGLPSKPRLVYRTGAPWSPPRGPEARRQVKELRPVYNHPLLKVWNGGMGGKVINVMGAHEIRFTSIDVVRFLTVDSDEEGSGDKDGEGTTEVKKPALGPVTIWVGVVPGSTRATPAHDAAQEVLALLAEHQITDVDVDFRESIVWPSY